MERGIFISYREIDCTVLEYGIKLLKDILFYREIGIGYKKIKFEYIGGYTEC